MAIDIKPISQLITEFRKLQSKDSITPESLGYLLQRLADLLATAGTSDTVAKIQQVIDGFKAAGKAICTFEQGAADRNNILVNSKEVYLATGDVGTRTNNLFIRQATTERAGAMRAQQVTDLNAARNKIAEIVPLLEKIQTKLGMNGSKGLYNNAQIHLSIENGLLKIFGAQQLIADGYVPYLFRHTRKRNQWDDKIALDDGATPKKYCDKRKGWNLYGSVYTLKIINSIVKISTNSKSHYTITAQGYSSEPSYFVKTFTRTRDKAPCFGWGRSVVSLLDPKNHRKHRMIRLRFAIGFAKKILPGRSLITTANLVSSLAEFSLIYNPAKKTWHFGK